MQTTIILVHGAFAESSSWHGVAAKLPTEHRVVAYANPLRGIASDAAGLTALVRSIDGPVVLAGHSYGGAVMTNVPADAGDIVGLVYVAAFALDAGESPGAAASLVPGGTLGDTLQPVPLADGGIDLYIAQEKYHAQFCADLPEDEAAAAGDHPATDHRGRPVRGLGGPAPVEVGPELVRLRRPGPQYPGRGAPDHGRTRRVTTHRRDRRRLARRGRLPS